MNQQSQTIAYATQLKLPNGAIYEGEVFENRPHGRGKMKYSNSQKYQGDFFQGMKQGKGKYYYMKGQLYIGDWFQNKKHGKGQYFYKNGDIYTGDFMNNLKHGNGRIEETNGNYYEGSFYMNYKDKEGIYYDTVNKKKIEFLYDKGKIIKQEEIPIIQSSGRKEDEEEQQQQQLQQEDEEDKDSSKKSQNNVKKGKAKMILSEEVFNSGDYSSETKRQYASYATFQNDFKKINSNKKTERSSHFKPEHFIDASLLEKKICQWGLEEVSAWLNQIGFGDCIEDFRENNIQGDSLLVLYNQDLKELRVNALGDRRILMREIQFLRLIFKSQCLNDQILQYSQRELNVELVRDLEEAKQSKFDSRPLNGDNGSSSSSSLSSNGNEKSSKIERKESKDSKTREGKDDKKHQQKKRERTSIQSKVSEYLNKKGIKLTFLIKKQQIQIIKPIGKGGYGQVFLGKLFGQEVAVKKYLKKRGFRNKHIAHFVEQVQVISKLTHPCIVLYMGMCIYDNQYALITQFLCGGSLFDCLHKKQQRLSQELLISFLKDVSLGMAYLHQKGVLHCDLKSSNLLIDQNQNIKLCDFGLSRIVSTKNKKKNKNIRVGTPHWMAPQILKGGKYECPSDVYSFGILMWEMMTGRIPYKDFSTAQIIGMVGNDQKHHIGVPQYPNKAIIDIFLRCTSRNPEDRPTFKIIVKQIEAIQQYLKDRPSVQQT